MTDDKTYGLLEYVHKEEASEINSYPVTLILSEKAGFSLLLLDCRVACERYVLESMGL